MELELQHLVTLLLGLLTVGGSYATVSLSRRRDKIEGIQVITDTTLSLIQPLREQVAELKGEVRALEWELRLWRELAERRAGQVVALGGAPIQLESLVQDFGGLNEEDPLE